MDLPQKDTEGFLFICLGCLLVFYSNVFEEVELFGFLIRCII